MRNVLLLAWLPSGLAACGAWLDERRALGFTIWRSACRASGLSLSSLATFTLELLPAAVIGALLGGLLVLCASAGQRRGCARDALAAHAGCALAMPIGLLLCAVALPWPLALASEALVASLAAVGVWWIARIRKATYPGGARRGVSRISKACAGAENFPVSNTRNPHVCN